MKLSPYLSFDGQCEAAFKFYEQCLGAKIEALMPYEGSPMANDVPPEWRGKVMHGEIKIGENVLMGGDCMPGKYQPARGTSLMVAINDPVKAESAFNQLSEEGTVEMPFEETFWAAKFGSVTDKFGIPWMINCDKPAE